MKKGRLLVSLSSLCLALILAALLFTAGCTGTPTQEAVELNCAMHCAPSPTMSERMEWWTSEIESRTKGAVTINLHWGGTLAKHPEMAQAIGTGVADLGTANWSIIGATPLESVADFAFGFWDKPLAAWMAAEQLSREAPEFEQKLADVNLKRLSYYGLGVFGLSSNKPVRTLADFEGFRMSASGGLALRFQATGAALSTIGGVEQFDAMDKGLIDGAAATVGMVTGYKLFEIAKYYTRIGVWGCPSAGAMINLDVWNSLSPDVQQVFEDLREEWVVRYAEKSIEETEEQTEQCIAAGVEFIDFPAEDLETLKNLPEIKQIPDDWIKRMVEQAKLPESRVREIHQQYMELLEENAEKYPQEF